MTSDIWFPGTKASMFPPKILIIIPPASGNTLTISQPGANSPTGTSWAVKYLVSICLGSKVNVSKFSTGLYPVTLALCLEPTL